MFAAEKKEVAIGESPVANMWWTQAPKPNSVTATLASATSMYAASGRRTNVGITVETIPNAGTTRMYTHGWPNSQNRYCQSRTLPPPNGS